ncbi:MAG: helix-turn-helix domain-containing protein [Planctomycetota bacterium]|jgi:hypothetical protein
MSSLDLSQLPEILHVEDLAAVFRLTVDGARRAVERGQLGPACKIGRRWVVRREALRAHLKALERAQAPEEPPAPQPGYVEALREATR